MAEQAPTSGSTKEAPVGLFFWVYRVVKVLSSLIGGPLALISLSALLGLFLSNLWLCLGIAAVVLIGIPLFIADRLLPDDDPKKGRGIPTEMLALTWLGTAATFIGLLGSFTGGLLHAEANRMSDQGLGFLAPLVHNLAGPVDEAVEETPVDSAQAPDAGVDDATPDAAAPDASVGDAAGDAPAEEEEQDPDEAMEPAELFSRWAPAVVSIQVSAGPLSGGGTGFVLNDEGLIATNHHVVRDHRNIRVKFKDGTFASAVYRVIVDEPADLAVLRVETDNEPPTVRMGNSDDITVGERAISIGNPLGLEHTLTDGIVSARRVYQGRPMIQMSTPVSPGNSGGPLFNAQGRVIGVTTAVVGMGFGQNLNLAVPINVLKELLEREREDEVHVGGGSLEGSGSW